MPSDLGALREAIERLYAEPPAAPAGYGPEHRDTFDRFKAALNRGEIRAAEPDPASPTGWRVNPWVKQGILAGFRMGEIVDMSVGAVPQAVLAAGSPSSTSRPTRPGRSTPRRGSASSPGGRRSATAAISGRG